MYFNSYKHTWHGSKNSANFVTRRKDGEISQNEISFLVREVYAIFGLQDLNLFPFQFLVHLLECLHRERGNSLYTFSRTSLIKSLCVVGI